MAVFASVQNSHTPVPKTIFQGLRTNNPHVSQFKDFLTGMGIDANSILPFLKEFLQPSDSARTIAPFGVYPKDSVLSSILEILSDLTTKNAADTRMAVMIGRVAQANLTRRAMTKHDYPSKKATAIALFGSKDVRLKALETVEDCVKNGRDPASDEFLESLWSEFETARNSYSDLLSGSILNMVL